MKQSAGRLLVAARMSAALVFASSPFAQADPLPSWNDGRAKTAIVRFVASVTNADDETYVAPEDRIAVFDSDGTLWVEQPVYLQVAFSLDRVRAMAPQHPEWRKQQPFMAVLRVDQQTLEESGEEGFSKILLATNSGLTTTEFNAIASRWIRTARHPRFRKPYADLIYQPMRELIDYLRDNDFKTFILAGGTADFVRAFSQSLFGVPPERVIGSTFRVRFEIEKNGEPVLHVLPKIDPVSDGPGKPVSIQRQIGRRPILALGNADGDLQMLQWTAGGDGPRFMGLVHHTDDKREYAYDRNSKIGELNASLGVASAEGWTVVDMRRDWNRVFPPVGQDAVGLTASTRRKR